jgi:acyl-CoA thioesterase
MATPKASFVKLMALETIGDGKDNTFMSKMPAWVPAGPAAYGGHVYAQAVWAASQTVKAGFVAHVWNRLQSFFLICVLLSTLYTIFWALHWSAM